MLAQEAAEATEYEGQAIFDRAVLQKLDARSMNDLEKVVDLCEDALIKGLDEENKAAARQLLTATLFEHASKLSQLIFDQRPPDARWATIRRFAMQDLEKSLDYDDSQGYVHLLIARLQMLPRGDKDRAKKAAERAIDLLQDQDELLSMALMVQGGLTDDKTQQLENFTKAIELNPRNADAWRARALLHLSQNEADAALADFLQLLNVDAGDNTVHQAVAELFARRGMPAEALSHLQTVIEQNPQESTPYLLKAEILSNLGQSEEALDTLDRAISVEPQDIAGRLMRARLYAELERFDEAERDIRRVLEVSPGLPNALLLRSVIAAAQEKYKEAIRDLRLVEKSAQDNPALKLQLATYYVADNRPTKAIAVFDEVLEIDSENWMALRSRGDAYLSLGEHQKAIADYEAGLKLQPDDGGILNNLAWVLATSPKDDVREPERAIELATKACEVTNFEKAHILSTLAAAYADAGKFEEAIKWSTKAVEMDTEEQQLDKELASYKEGKPWRELQETDESAAGEDLPLEEEAADDDEGFELD
ncbi:MAG: tetratricopeptide repeat protein [Pirellulaceae bacterium]